MSLKTPLTMLATKIASGFLVILIALDFLLVGVLGSTWPRRATNEINGADNRGNNRGDNAFHNVRQPLSVISPATPQTTNTVDDDAANDLCRVPSLVLARVVPSTGLAPQYWQNPRRGAARHPATPRAKSSRTQLNKDGASPHLETARNRAISPETGGGPLSP